MGNRNRIKDNTKSQQRKIVTWYSFELLSPSAQLSFGTVWHNLHSITITTATKSTLTTVVSSSPDFILPQDLIGLYSGIIYLTWIVVFQNEAHLSRLLSNQIVKSSHFLGSIGSRIGQITISHR